VLESNALNPMSNVLLPAHMAPPEVPAEQFTKVEWIIEAVAPERETAPPWPRASVREMATWRRERAPDETLMAPPNAACPLAKEREMLEFTSEA